MKSLDRDVKLSVMDIIMDFISTPFRMANNGVDVNDIVLDPNSSDKTKAYLAKNLEQLENEKVKTKTIENKGRITGIPGIKVDNISLENVGQEMTEQSEQIKEVKSLDEK